jgi:hypothetical protein
MVGWGVVARVEACRREGGGGRVREGRWSVRACSNGGVGRRGQGRSLQAGRRERAVSKEVGDTHHGRGQRVAVA